MSRSGYSDDCENMELYRAAVERAIKGKRGQAFLRELADALDALQEKVLISGELITSDGLCCTMGAICKARSLDVSKIDYEDPDTVGSQLGIARSMAAEIAFMNDEWESPSEEPAGRWQRMRRWVAENLLPTLPETEGWLCECGAAPQPSDASWRWSGSSWQHHHGYPMGHVDAKKF